MEKNIKFTYEAPTMEVFSIVTKGTLLQGSKETNQFNLPEYYEEGE